MKKFTQRLKQFLNTLKFIFVLIKQDIHSNLRTFKVALSSIILVVTFLITLQSLLQLTPLLFVKLAEEQSGQVDIALLPLSASNSTRSNDNKDSMMINAINFTDLEQKISGLPEIKALAPRWTFPINVSNPEFPNQNHKTMILILNSDKERKQGIGNHFNAKDLEGGECWITESLASLLQLKGKNFNFKISLNYLGQEIILKVNLLELIQNKMASLSNGSIDDLLANKMIEKVLENYFVNNRPGDPSEKNIQPRKSFQTKSFKPTKENKSIKKDLENPFDFNSKIVFPSILEGNLQKPGSQNEFDDSQNETNESNFQSQLTTFFASVILQTLKIVESFKTSIVSSPNGKWPINLGNVVIIDSKYINSLLKDRFFEELQQTPINTGSNITDDILFKMINDPEFLHLIDECFEDFNIDDYALAANILLKNRDNVYSSEASIKSNLIATTNNIISHLDKDYSVKVTSPLADVLTSFFLFQNFLENTFIAIIFIVTILAIFLIYSLMNSNVSERKYEFGILRVLGIKRKSLLILMIYQSLIFIIPGILCGLVLAFTLVILTSYIVFDSTLLKTSYMFSSSAIGLGIGVGFIIPFLSNVFPTRKVFSKTLADSLSAASRTISDITIHIAKLSMLGISIAKTVGAMTLLVIGFLAFYVAPYGFMFADFALFLLILNIILLFMIFGLSLLVNLLQKFLGKVVLNILLLFCWKDRLLKSIIQKNLISHYKRNNKASLIFTLTISFLIFAGVAFWVNSDLIIQQIQYNLGSDIVVQGLTSETKFLNEAELRDVLQDFERKYPSVIRAYAFISQPFSQQAQVDELKLMPLAPISRTNIEIISVDGTYLKSIYEDLYVPGDFDSSIGVTTVPNTGYVDVVQALYQRKDFQNVSSFDEYNIISDQNLERFSLDEFIGRRKIKVIIAKSTAIDLATKLGKFNIITVGNVKFQSYVQSVVTKLPGFAFTGYKNTDKQNIVITSHEDFRFMRDVVWNRKANLTNLQKASEYNLTIPDKSSFGVPKLGLLIRLNDKVEENIKVELFNKIQNLVDGEFTFTTDVRGLVKTFEEALYFVDIFFIVVAAIAIILTFFFSTVTFTGNVYENLWEFGVLRATGLTKKQITKTFILEALSVVISSIILGTSVGIMLAIIVTAQFNLFTELPFKFIFPVPVFLFTIVSFLLVAVISPLVAVNKIKNKQISSIIRALD